jgi:hypothetical protein
MNGKKINGCDSTSAAPAVCFFKEGLYLFWKAKDSSNGIYYTFSWDGKDWSDGQKITKYDSTSAAPAACVFNNDDGEFIYLFWKGNDSSNRIYYAQSDGRIWSDSRKITPDDSTSAAPAACEFKGRLYVFFKASDSSGRIFYIFSPDGQNWSGSRKITPDDSTSAAPAACEFDSRLYVFFKASDSSGRIFYISSQDGQNWSGSRTINDRDTTAAALAACAFYENKSPDKCYLFWKGTDYPYNSLCYGVAFQG